MSIADDLENNWSTARPLLIETGLKEYPIGLWGTWVLVGYREQLFAVTAAHLVRDNDASQLRLLATHGSRYHLPISTAFGVKADEPASEVDVMVYPASMLGIDLVDAGSGRLILAERAGVDDWQRTAFVSQFAVIGYPRERNEVNYEARQISTARLLVPGVYAGPSPGSNSLHTIEVEDPHGLSEFAGFSGGPVFSLQDQVAAPPVTRFCGIAVAGTPRSRRMHFVDARKVCRLMDFAIEHQARFGLGPLTTEAAGQ